MNYKVIGFFFFTILGLAAVWMLINIYAKIDLGALPPENITATRMNSLKQRIIEYAKTKGKLPDKLSDLPPLQDHVNKIDDAWGNEIILTVKGKAVTLTSLGKDKKPGGTEDNLDVIGIFEVNLAAGGLNGQQIPWKVKPLAAVK